MCILIEMTHQTEYRLRMLIDTTHLMYHCGRHMAQYAANATVVMRLR